MPVEYNMQEALATTLELVNRKLRQSFEQELLLYNQFAKVEKAKTNQRGYRIAIYTSPNVSINNRPESGLLPAGGTHKNKEMRVFYARPAIARRLSGDVLDLDNQDTLLRALTDGMDLDYATFKKEIEQQMFGDGTGLKGVVASVATAVVTMAEPYGADQFNDGAQLQFYNPATGLARSATVRTVAQGGVDKPNLQVTFTADVSGDGIQAGDHVTWANSYLQAITGIKRLVANDTGDFQGVSRGDVPNMKSPNLDALSQRLSLSKIDQQELQVVQRTGKMDGASGHVYVSGNTQIMAYRELGRNYQWYVSGSKFDGGNGGISNQAPNGRAIMFAPDCDKDRFYLLDFSGFFMVELKKFGILGHDGQRLRMVPGYDNTGTGSFFDSNVYFVDWKGDIGLYEPQKQSVIINLDGTGLVSSHI